MLGFEARYLRPEEGFACLALGDAELMIDQIGLGRDFRDLAPDRPLATGLNLQIRVSSVAPLLAALARHGLRLHLPLEDRWYRRDTEEVGNRQFVVADPDGYLLRFFEYLGARALDAGAAR